jgi:hypothetical protein
MMTSDFLEAILGHISPLAVVFIAYNAIKSIVI